MNTYFVASVQSTSVGSFETSENETIICVNRGSANPPSLSLTAKRKISNFRRNLSQATTSIELLVVWSIMQSSKRFL